MDRFPPPKQSWLDVLANHPEAERLLVDLGDRVGALTDDLFFSLRREQHLPPDDALYPIIWFIWYINAGRGWGKTVAGAYAVNKLVAEGKCKYPILIGPTAGDVRDTMIEGPTGILATSHKDFMPEYEPSKRRITWPNGVKAITFSAEKPARVRGGNFDLGWLDEIATWQYLKETWDMYKMAVRLSKRPRTIITTTPKPIKLLKEIKGRESTIVTIGTTFDNTSLSEEYIKDLRRDYDGTRIGLQEIYAKDLEEAEGALWNRDLIDETRIKSGEEPEMRRIVIALDPAGGNTENSDDMGVIVAGLGENSHGYIFEDLSGRMSPGEVAQRGINAYILWGADRIVAEANFGGDWIELPLRQLLPNVSYRKLHASRSKQARAEPVAALYEQKRVHHVGTFEELEDQLCGWEPNTGQRSPDRLDALVWAITELMLAGQEMRIVDTRY